MEPSPGALRLAAGEGRVATFLGRQLRVAALLGLACGLLVGGVALLLNSSPRIGAVVGGSLFAAILVSAALGALLPLALERLGFDPATISGPVISAVNDILGIVIYFSLAARFL